jgi:hypothetical protein
MHVVAPELRELRIPMPIPASHFVNGTELEPPFPAGLETAVFGMGCFWGAEKRFWELEGVYTTAVGYAGGSLLTLPIERCVVEIPDMLRSCSWSMTQR